MSDMGEYWDDIKEMKRVLRVSWHECPTCKKRFGTGTKVPPGDVCRHCGWKAPGEFSEETSFGYYRGRSRRR